MDSREHVAESGAANPMPLTTQHERAVSPAADVRDARDDAWRATAFQGQKRRLISLPRVIAALLIVSSLFFAFSGGMLFQRVFITPDAAASTPEAPAAFGRAWEVIHTRYVDTAAIDDQRMLDAAIGAMVDTLGDEGHTRYQTAEQAQAERESLSGEYSGVGIQVEQRDDGIVVVAPIDNSPAMEAGMQTGDIIVGVDGASIRGQSIDDVIGIIRGPEGSRVVLEVERASEEETLFFDLIRRRITVSAVSWTMIDDENALIRLSQFSSGAGNDVAAALDAARNAGATGIVLDLRNNPGGYVNEAIQIGSMFVPEGSTIFQTQVRDGSRTPHVASAQPAHIGDMPLVVLINEGSASSAEIVSGAVKANNPNATVIGETTFGTGTVLNSFPLGDGSSLLLGTELWLTPVGAFIREHGVRPDVLVALKTGQSPHLPGPDHEAPEPGTLNDHQLEWAIHILASDQAGSDYPSRGTPPGRSH
ncbi:MAG TPA: S41 family peptidase [Thermomicrobiales bacterium]|nr:S41 family peptidase [Thermomicrobiales bacterium]